jgi:hypothetical protein
MALNRGEVNALSVLGVRKLSFIPSHFTKISIERSAEMNVKQLENWIAYHLNSRYAIVTKFSLDHNKKVVPVTEIGIENSKEATMMILGCHLLQGK